MAYYHPQFVHFAIALLVVGVIFRIVSLLGRPAWIAPAAFSLIAAGTVAAVLAAQSGQAAHGPVERIPGARQAVADHEKWGERTRNVFVLVLAIEGIGLLLYRSPRRRSVYIASAVVGVIGLAHLYEAGAHGGVLVYAYAGAVGTRSGDPNDVERLLLAGLYNEAQLERKAGRPDRANQLLALAGERHPHDPEVQLAVAESQLLDRKDPAAALQTLRAISAPADDRSLRIRHGMVTADALEAAGQREGAAAVVQGLLTQYPEVARLKQRLDALTKPKA